MAKLKIPTIFTIKRSIQSSDGIFRSGTNLKVTDTNIQLDNIKDILVREIGIKASKSNYENNEIEIKNKLHESNLQRIEISTLDSENDWLSVSYNVNFTNQLSPYSCNDLNFSQNIVDFIELFSNKIGYRELIERYLLNIISATPMWRNREFSEEGYVEINFNDEQGKKNTLIFKIDLNKEEIEVKDLLNDNLTLFNKLVDFVLNAYESKKTATLDVNNYLKLGKGQEVFPSQEFIDEKSKGDNVPSRVLAYTIINGKKVAVYHNAKIGNAIRKIDNWYGSENEVVYKVPVEPFAPEQNKALVHRVSNNFYKLLETNFHYYIRELQSNNPEESALKDIYFIIACFIRGGVFNGKK